MEAKVCNMNSDVLGMLYEVHDQKMKVAAQKSRLDSNEEDVRYENLLVLVVRVH